MTVKRKPRYTYTHTFILTIQTVNEMEGILYEKQKGSSFTR